MNNLKKIATMFVILLALSVLYSYFALRVDNNLYDEDIEAIKLLEVSDACLGVTYSGFDEELNCLVSIQTAVQAIGEDRCANSDDKIEPSEFIRRDFGCCFDRARFIEKAARYFGFQTRRVFIIQKKFGNSLTNFFPLNQASHAASEILTKKGWLGVDSNLPFIILDSNKNPKTYRSALDDIDNFPMVAPRPFFIEDSIVKDFDIIYGLYSRHGNFHGENFPGPEFVFSELLWN
tara:strand:- start:172 stop:873 length:702 start_codon:yes stop_codon:yes gene_type:complete